MIRSERIESLFIILYLFFIVVECTNYGYSVSRSHSYPTFLASAPSVIFKPNVETNASVGVPVKPPKKSETPFTIYYPLQFPQSRGGKTLNFTLIAKSPLGDREQPRILNQPNWYQNIAVSDVSSRKDVSNTKPEIISKENENKRTPVISKTPPTNYKSIIYEPHQPANLENRNAYPIFSSEIVRNPEQRYIFKPPQTIVYPGPQTFRTPTTEDLSPFNPQNIPKTTNIRFKPPPHLYYATSGSYTLPPPTQEPKQNLPCFCVPYYLCKNGVINSGGRSVAAVRRRARSLSFDYRNLTQPRTLVQPKLLNGFIVEQESEGPVQCEGQNVCCRVSFADDVPGIRDEKHYPIATPRPEIFYPTPARERVPEIETCGVRRAYGIYARLKQLQYPADVSEFGEYPWQAAVLKRMEGQKSLYLCGGVLISPQWVATAAHCIKNQQYSPLQIRLGEWDVNRKDEVYPYIEKDVDSIILHPEFNPDTLYNDLALIRLESPVDARIPHISPACLPKRDTIYEDQKCWVSGWGKDFFGTQGEYQNVLKEVDIPVVARDVCSTQLRTTNLGPDFFLHPGFLCAGGEPGKDACTGDGGSPLVCLSGRSWYVVGLVSWGIGCGQPGIPGIYVNMLFYMDWINSIVRR